MEKNAECRGCGRAMLGYPYHTGKGAWLQNSKRHGLIRAPSCHYGGYVCSEQCDRRACGDLEGSMPGCSPNRPLMGNLSADITRKWDHLRREYPNVNFN